LRELGWVEGSNLVIEARGAGGQLDRLPGLARELVALSPALIVASAPQPSRAAKDATSVIPSVPKLLKGMWIEEVLAAPHSPWQNPFVERLIGSIRRECLNHVLVLGERHLRRVLIRYFIYYHQARTHLALEKDAPDLRPVQLPAAGRIVQLPEVGGLHHRYLRQAA